MKAEIKRKEEERQKEKYIKEPSSGGSKMGKELEFVQADPVNDYMHLPILPWASNQNGSLRKVKQNFISITLIGELHSFSVITKISHHNI